MSRVKSIMLLVFVVTVCASCSESDSKPYSFKDQDVKGKIAETAWSYTSGKFRYSNDQQFIYITLYPTNDNPVCSAEELRIVEIAVPAEVGLYKLNNTDIPGLLVFLRDNGVTIGGNPFTAIAEKGAVEILSISETGLTGRVDARSSSDNYVNGNFTVTFCPGS